MTILILGKCEDPHVKSVCAVLEEEGFPCTLIDHERPEGNSFSLNEKGEPALLTKEERRQDITLLWNRVKLPLRFVGQDEAQRAEHVKSSEWYAFYAGLCHTSKAPVVNDIGAHFKCKNKLYQHTIAGRLGFKNPPTCIATSKKTALEFLNQQGSIITKALGRANIPLADGSGLTRAIMTSRVSRKQLDKATEEQFSFCPVFFQKDIPKDYELRVVMVGRFCWAFSIQSQKQAYTETDWRYGNTTLDFTPIPLESRIEEGLQNFLKEMGLYYGIFDLIVDPEGEVWFLECNSEGQWGWLDPIVDGDISRGFARAFKEKARTP